MGGALPTIAYAYTSHYHVLREGHAQQSLMVYITYSHQL